MGTVSPIPTPGWVSRGRVDDGLHSTFPEPKAWPGSDGATPRRQRDGETWATTEPLAGSTLCVSCEAVGKDRHHPAEARATLEGRFKLTVTVPGKYRARVRLEVDSTHIVGDDHATVEVEVRVHRGGFVEGTPPSEEAHRVLRASCGSSGTTTWELTGIVRSGAGPIQLRPLLVPTVEFDTAPVELEKAVHLLAVSLSVSATASPSELGDRGEAKIGRVTAKAQFLS